MTRARLGSNLDDVIDTSLEGLSGIWKWFAEREFGTYSPLYASIARTVADDKELLRLVLDAPAAAHQPNVLLAAVHYLLLSGSPHPLAALYAAGPGANLDETEPGQLFRDFCLTNREAILDLMAVRRTQTNEVGRSSVLAVGLSAAAEVIGEPMALLDAGSSAGLNLLLDRYLLDYGEHGTVGPMDSPVRVECEVRGDVNLVPERLPALGPRLGLDRSPPDVTDPDDARWLLACVWPDTYRLPRAAAALEMARQEPPAIETGDMVEDLGRALGLLGHGPVAVVTSWSYSYLSPGDQQAFVEILAEEGRRRPVAWVSCDGHGVVGAFDAPDTSSLAAGELSPSVLGLAVYDAAGGSGGSGRSEARPLALVQPHGAWIVATDSA